ncbi:MAG: DUF3373 domain-containing protein [Trichlorobacter sp.]|nr:DUF3373 domain-containing protein [Trichlorobacter sp.]
MEQLKGQVERMENKSLGKWLHIGGSYQFRMDSLHGKTKAYTDPMTSDNFGQIAGYMLSNGYATDVQQIQDMMVNTTDFNTAYGFTGMLKSDPAFENMLQNSMVTTNPYKPRNSTIYTNKFNLDIKAQATQNVSVNVKLGMYKTFGSQDDNAVNGNAFFADRTGVFDGTLGHVPSNSYLNVDRAYATWSEILGEPIWLSVGRRPSTDGAPFNLKNNTARPGNGGTPSLLVNYAFDGMTLGYAPDIEALPGFYAKVCYGRGFDSGFRSTPNNSLKDTDMLGVAIIPYETDPLRVWFQWNRGFNIFDFPVMKNTAFGDTRPSTSLGDIDWFGLGAMSTLKNVGPGDLNFFVDGGISVTRPNNNVSGQAMFQGLLSGSPFSPEAAKDKTGYAIYTGIRYDLPSKTKIGFEYNYGSKNWITFAPAAEDMWTSKVGTRGHVFEPYIIQELDLKPISSYFAKAFFKLGYQYYDFQYTGSNNWVGAPIKISTITPDTMLMQAPVKNAHDIYGTFVVQF